MSRSYSKDVRLSASEIAYEVVRNGYSTNWSGTDIVEDIDNDVNYISLTR